MSDEKSSRSEDPLEVKILWTKMFTGKKIWYPIAIPLLIARVKNEIKRWGSEKPNILYYRILFRKIFGALELDPGRIC